MAMEVALSRWSARLWDVMVFGAGSDVIAHTTAAPVPQRSVLGMPGWLVAVACSVLCSALTVVGFMMQKKAIAMPRKNWHIKLGDMVLSPLWVGGLSIGVLVPIVLQVVSYSLAPMSLLTPLSGVTVALNTCLAPRLLGEQCQRFPDYVASALILLGTVLTTVAGDHSEVDYSLKAMEGLSTKAVFLVALAVLVLILLWSLYCMSALRSDIEASAMARSSNPHLGHVLLPAFAAAGCGCLANLMLKAFGELLKVGFSLSTFLMLVATAIPAVGQLNFVNRGLRLYQQTVFFPVYNALLVLTCTIYGLLFYREYAVLFRKSWPFACFALGLLSITFGVLLFTFRTSESEAARDARQFLSEEGQETEMSNGSRRKIPTTSELVASELC